MPALLPNKLGLTDAIELAHREELLTKRRALELYDKRLLEQLDVGTFQSLASIHGYLFQDVYDFAGKLRTVNIAKGNFRFAPVLYLKEALASIDGMPQTTFDEIVEKYVEMNVAHPFREGNGRSTRIWLDAIFRKELKEAVDWSYVDKEDYLLAMERSPVRDTEIKHLLAKAMTTDVENREVFMKGIDASYRYEGYHTYPTKTIDLDLRT
ncbi:protein adenylyltransferase Fic [uncultured Selenomonas sp.]|uniref:protein adenylyltransferase Fic n=1 Tax=uncultured Selenomonas sp. TaxID=159275 RepID=UPI0025D2457D|nr:Fic family protein [uncultured Selenomonas sp.]